MKTANLRVNVHQTSDWSGKTSDWSPDDFQYYTPVAEVILELMQDTPDPLDEHVRWLISEGRMGVIQNVGGMVFNILQLPNLLYKSEAEIIDAPFSPLGFRVIDLTGNYSFHSMTVGDIMEVGGHYFMVEREPYAWKPLKTLGVCASLPLNECMCV